MNFSKILNTIKNITDTVTELQEAAGNVADSVRDNNAHSNNAYGVKEREAAAQTSTHVPVPIKLAPSSHLVEEIEYGQNTDGADSKYSVTFQINDAFEPFESHAGEVEMGQVYGPSRDDLSLYFAVILDDAVYTAVDEYKKSGTFDGARELSPLNGTFLFKAKQDYYGSIMYFYGLDRCDGFWENNGLCLIYPKEYAGTDDEKLLMSVLDEIADTYKEEKMG